VIAQRTRPGPSGPGLVLVHTPAPRRDPQLRLRPRSPARPLRRKPPGEQDGTGSGIPEGSQTAIGFS